MESSLIFTLTIILILTLSTTLIWFIFNNMGKNKAKKEKKKDLSENKLGKNSKKQKEKPSSKEKKVNVSLAIINDIFLTLKNQNLKEDDFQSKNGIGLTDVPINKKRSKVNIDDEEETGKSRVKRNKQNKDNKRTSFIEVYIMSFLFFLLY